MKKSFIYIMSSVEIVIGAFILSLCSIIKNSLPILGRVAYQSAAAGSYNPSDYTASFPLATTIAVLLIVVGIEQLALSIIKK